MSWFDLVKNSPLSIFNKSHRAPKIEQGLKEVDLVFLDGVFSLENSSGVCSSVLSIKSFDELSSNDFESFHELFPEGKKSYFSCLNDAFLHNGFLFKVLRGTKAKIKLNFNWSVQTKDKSSLFVKIIF